MADDIPDNASDSGSTHDVQGADRFRYMTFSSFRAILDDAKHPEHDAAVAYSRALGKRLRPLIDSAVKPTVPVVDTWRLGAVGHSRAFDAIAANAAKWGSLVDPGGQIASIVAQATRASDAFPGLAPAIMVPTLPPVFDSASALGKLATLKVDIGALPTWGPTLAAASWTRLFEGVVPAPNLRGVEGLSLSRVSELGEAEGLSLMYVPRASVVTEVLGAEDTASRLRVLYQRRDEIMDDCVEQLDYCTDVELTELVPAAREAIECLRASMFLGAQALAASVLDSTLQRVYDRDVYDAVKRRTKDGQPTQALEDMGFRDSLVFVPVWTVYQQYWVHNGDPIPSTFARHASAHAVGAVQYTPANAVHSIMIATTLLRHTQELSRQLGAGG